MKNVLKLTCLVAALVVATFATILLPATTQAAEQEAPDGSTTLTTSRVFTGSVDAPPFMRFRYTEYGSGGAPGDRSRHTATLLQDGRVLVAGGYANFTIEAQPVKLSTAVLYVPGTGWVPTGSMHYARAGHVATLLPDGRVRVDGEWTTPPEIYDPTSGTWSTEVGAQSAPVAPAINTGLGAPSQASSSQSLEFCSAYEEFRIGCILDDFEPYADVTLADGTKLGFGYLMPAFYDEEAIAWRHAGFPLAQRGSFRTITLLQDGDVLLTGMGEHRSYLVPEIATYIPANSFTGTLSLSTELTPTVSFSGQTSGAPLEAAALSNNGSGWSEWIEASAGVTVTVPWEFSRRVDYLYLYLRLRDTNGNEADVVTATVDGLPPIGSVVVNRGTTTQQGAIHTTSGQVVLALDATDERSGVAQIRTRVDNNAPSDWSVFTAAHSIDLGPDNGLKTVFVEYMDFAGNVSLPVTDTILLDRGQGSDYGIAVDEDALWTNSTATTLTIPAIAATAEMQVSNGGSFSGSSWEPYRITRDWEITSFGTSTIPRTVYVRFRDTNGTTSHTFQDDIVLDQQAPASSVLPIDIASASMAASEGTDLGNPVPVLVRWAGNDDVSGIKGFDIQVQTTPGVWTDWLVQTSGTEAVYQAQPDSRLSFRSRAADYAGNVEEYPQAADVTVTVGTPVEPAYEQLYLPAMSR